MLWRQKERKVSRSKTEYICVHERETGLTVKIPGADEVKVDEFIYMWSNIQSKGWCTREVKKDEGRLEFQG